MAKLSRHNSRLSDSSRMSDLQMTSTESRLQGLGIPEWLGPYKGQCALPSMRPRILGRLLPPWLGCTLRA